MATKVRQMVPMAGETNTRYANQVYVTDDAEASRLEAAGIAEILETGLADAAILPSPNEPTLPEGSMAAPAGDPAPAPSILILGDRRKNELVAIAGALGLDADGNKDDLVKRIEAEYAGGTRAEVAARVDAAVAAKEAAGDGANAPTNPAPPAADAENDPNAGGEAGGNSQ